jgi:hypothetical protein
VKFHIDMLRPFVEFRVARKRNGGLVVSHDVSDRRPVQPRFGQESAKALQMQNGIVLSNVLSMSRRRGHFPLSFGRPGHSRTCKLEYIARCRVCTVSDDGATKVSVCVAD